MNNTIKTIKGLTPNEIVNLINGYKNKNLCEVFGYPFFSKLEKTEESLKFVKEIRKMLKGTLHRIIMYGRHPHRKENGIQRENGAVRLKLASQISLYMRSK